MKDINVFLEEHRVRPEDISMHNLVEVFTSEMVKGLRGEESSLRMIPTYIEADNEFLTEKPVLAIDAGGTNFRAAMVTFRKNGNLEISNKVNAPMPGLDGEISKEEFFDIIAGYIKSMAGTSDRIGFCFSYPTEILPDRDGRLLQFCKEVQAPGVVGQLVGRSLIDTLGMPDKQVVLLNDTVATLLAGKSYSIATDYDSYIGYILGTGTNTCYIETNKNIHKKPGLNKNGSQIINVESGNFGKAPRSDLDMLFDNFTVNPGNYTFEKMISGGYIGNLCLCVLKCAAKEAVFSVHSCDNILSLNQLNSEDLNNFLINPEEYRGPLEKCISTLEDDTKFRLIAECLIERAAKLVASNLASVVLKTGRGKSPENPILVTIEGTTFYKLHNLRPLFEHYFYGYLTGDRRRFCEFAEVPDSSLTGAALAALIRYSQK